MSCRALRKQHRIRLHTNFFLSLLLKEIAVALWDMLITYERITNSDSSNTVLAQNGVSISTFYSLNTLLSFVYLYIAVGDPVIKRERVGIPLTGSIPFLCLSQAMTWISNVIFHRLFVFSEWRWGCDCLFC